MKSEGLIEKGYDWNVYWSDLEINELKSDKFRGYLQSWKSAIEEKKSNTSRNEPEIDLSKLGLGKLFSMISLPQLWKLLGVLATLIALTATGSYKLGADQWPWQDKPNKRLWRQ